MPKYEAFKILIVCMGNICRSPTAEAVLRAKVREAGKRGYDMESLVASQVTKEDFVHYDLILAMDWENHAMLQQLAARQHHHKIKLLMSFATEHESAVIPDPYYGGADGF